MKKFLSSKLFVILTPIFTLVIGFLAGWLLGYQPIVSGSTSGGSFSVYGKTTTQFVFQIKTGIGYWLLALIISLVILLLCVLIQKQYSDHQI